MSVLQREVKIWRDFLLRCYRTFILMTWQTFAKEMNVLALSVDYNNNHQNNNLS